MVMGRREWLGEWLRIGVATGRVEEDGRADRFSCWRTGYGGNGYGTEKY
jgi:hypothetical protein